MTSEAITNHICGNCRNYKGGIYGRCRIYNYTPVTFSTNGNACFDYASKGWTEK